MSLTLPILFNDRHILPSGHLPLRVFPGAQMETLTYAMKNNLPLGICMDEKSNINMSIATEVIIEDFFAKNRDGILTINVCGKRCFLIEKTEQLTAGITLAHGEILPKWPEQEICDDSAPLAERLQAMYDRYPELRSLHSTVNFDSLTWLCQRWLELLPLPASEKQMLMSANSCSDTAEYLISLMKDPH